MTGITISAWAGIVGRMSAWVRRQQRALSDRVHAAGDERARSHGWTVTETTGRFGFGARIYRDPRFGAPRPADRDAPAAQQSPLARSAASGADHVDSVVLDPVHDGPRRAAGRVVPPRRPGLPPPPHPPGRGGRSGWAVSPGSTPPPPHCREVNDDDG